MHVYVIKKTICLTFTYFIIDVVWTNTKQSHLIDSMLNNFYIPPVIFSCKKLDDKRWIRVCIDGKQRLTSINK